MNAIGKTQWAIAEGYIPPSDHEATRQLTSHETLCILNAGDREAVIQIMVFYVDHEPVGPYQVTVGARRTLHLRFNDLTTPALIPRDTDFASVLTSNVPVVVQHTRLDSRQAALALLSTIAYSE